MKQKPISRKERNGREEGKKGLTKWKLDEHGNGESTISEQRDNDNGGGERCESTMEDWKFDVELEI